MTPPLFEDALFHGPLSAARADRLVGSLGPLDGRHVVDLGCGWAELLLRILAANTTATGHGVDTDRAAIEHGRANAADRGLADRVVLDVADASTWTGGGADVIVINGASHVWGGEAAEHTPNALRAARAVLRPGGRLLLGEGFWEREPTPQQLAAMPIPREECRFLPDLVDLTLQHGFRLLNLSRASRDEWDDFESRHALGWERAILAGTATDDVEHRADTHRNHWLRGWRDVLGFVYLTLALPG